jgi:hypothetical protein
MVSEEAIIKLESARSIRVAGRRREEQSQHHADARLLQIVRAAINT